MSKENKKTNNKNIAIEILKRYCAYQERCIADVKLYAIKKQIPKNIIELIIPILVENDYLNEKRFVQSFVRGKFSQNKWGKIKIKFELQKKGIPETLITKSLKEINEDEYNQVVKKLITQKLSNINANTDVQIIYQKTMQYLISKGFEYEVVKDIYNKIQKQNKT